MTTLNTTEDVYKIHVKCTNCRYESSTPSNMVEIKKGISVLETLLNKPCPQCGCKNLKHV